MEDVIENLKYSSNKLTQILWHELESNGVKEYKLKPETLKKIKEEDFSSYYDKNNLILHTLFLYIYFLYQL